MLGRLYEDETCSAARALEVVGERWSLLILRNSLFGGMTRFTELQHALGVAPNVLAKRLAFLVDAGLLEFRPESGGGKGEYLPTEMAVDMKPVILALTEWGDKWAAPEGRPVIYRHAHCGGEVALSVTCAACGQTVASPDVAADVAPWVLERNQQTTPGRV